MFVCEECGKSYKSERTLSNHKFKEHGDEKIFIGSVSVDPKELPKDVKNTSKSSKAFTDLLALIISIAVIAIVKNIAEVSEEAEEKLGLSDSQAKVMLGPIVDLISSSNSGGKIVKVVGEKSDLILCVVSWVQYIQTINTFVKENPKIPLTSGQTYFNTPEKAPAVTDIQGNPLKNNQNFENVEPPVVAYQVI